MSRKKNYPAHSHERVYQARYVDKYGNIVKQTRASSIGSAVTRCPGNFLKYGKAVEVEIIHIHDRYKHPEALATISRVGVKSVAIEVSVKRVHLP